MDTRESKINPWGFGVLFMIIASFLMYHNFDIPTYFLFQDTKITKAVVIKTRPTYGIKGTQLQYLTYVYIVGDSSYTDSFKTKAKYRPAQIGDSLIIKYAIKKPSKNKIVGQV